MNPVITTIRYTEFPVNRGVVAVPDGAGEELGTPDRPRNYGDEPRKEGHVAGAGRVVVGMDELLLAAQGTQEALPESKCRGELTRKPADSISSVLRTPTSPTNFILIEGGRDFVTCEDIVRAAEEKHRRVTKNILTFLAFYLVAIVGAFVLVELVLHCDEVFR